MLFCFSTIDCVVFCCRVVDGSAFIFSMTDGVVFCFRATHGSTLCLSTTCVFFSLACVREGAACFSTAGGSTSHFSTTSGTAASALKMGQPFIFSITDDVGFCSGWCSFLFQCYVWYNFCLSTTDDGGFVHLFNGKCNCTTDTTDLYLDMMLLCSHIYSSEGDAVIQRAVRK